MAKVVWGLCCDRLLWGVRQGMVCLRFGGAGVLCRCEYQFSATCAKDVSPTVRTVSDQECCLIWFALYLLVPVAVELVC